MTSGHSDDLKYFPVLVIAFLLGIPFIMLGCLLVSIGEAIISGIRAIFRKEDDSWKT